MRAPITTRFVDNPIWLAPEVLTIDPYDERVDIYAYGVILWEILSREVKYLIPISLQCVLIISGFL